MHPWLAADVDHFFDHLPICFSPIKMNRTSRQPVSQGHGKWEMWTHNERSEVLHKYGGGGRGWCGRLKGRKCYFWWIAGQTTQKESKLWNCVLAFPKIKNLTVMLTNIQENPKNCTRLYMNRYPFFKLIRAEKQRKGERC